MYKRILAVGDVHGQYDKLLSLYDKLDFNTQEDLLIFLGDYIQGGDKPCEVLEWMIDHHHDNIVYLRGNTDQMVIDSYRRSPGQGTLWIPKEKRQDKAEPYLKFLNSLLLSYKISVGNINFFFCHAGVNSSRSFEEQSPRDLLIYNDEVIDSSYSGNAVLVVGHTQVCKLEPGRYVPLVKKNIIMMDTSAKRPEGKLSCMDVLSGTLWQSD